MHNIDYILNNTNNDLLKEFILLNIDNLDSSILYQGKNTIFHIIGLRGFDEILDEFLKYKCIIKKKTKKIKKILNSFNNENLTPLHNAAIYGYIDVCKILLKYGANIDIQNDFKNTPIHYAIINGHVNVVELFISHNCNLQLENNDLHTPYKLMFKYMKSAIDKLLDKKVKIIARVSSSYKKNITITEDKNITINRDLQIIYCKNSKILQENQKFQLKKQKKQQKKQKQLNQQKQKKQKTLNKIIPIININNGKKEKPNLKQLSKKDKQVALLSKMNIKERKLLVEYDYTEINDKDIIKFINKGDLEIITNPWFVVLMDYYWKSFAKKIFIQQFTISIVYMLLFS